MKPAAPVTKIVLPLKKLGVFIKHDYSINLEKAMDKEDKKRVERKRCI